MPNETLQHNINYFSQLRKSIIKSDPFYFVESGDVVGEQRELPIKDALLYFKNSGQLSASQYSELTALYEIAYNKEVKEPVKRLDVSTLRLETYEDFKRVIENSHKKVLPAGKAYVETPELIYWAKLEQKISAKEAKNLLRLYIKKLFDHQGRSHKKEIIASLYFACKQGILESVDELIFVLETVRNEKIRLEILEKINTNNIDKFTHPAEDWISVSSNSGQGEVEANLQEIEAMTQDVFEGHRIFSEQTKTLKEDINRLRDRGSKQDEEILNLRLGVDEKDKRIQSLEEQKQEAEANYVEALSKISDAFDAEKAKTQHLESAITNMEKLQEEGRKATRKIIKELGEKLSKSEAQIKKLGENIKNMSLAEKERITNDEKIIEDLETANKDHLDSIEDLSKKIEALEKTLETLKTEKVALEFYIEKSLQETTAERTRQEEKISTLETTQETQEEQTQNLEAENTNKELEIEALKTKNIELEKGIKALQIERANTKIQTNRIKLMLSRSKEAMLQPSIQ